MKAGAEGLDGLVEETADIREPGAGEVQVAVACVSLNRRDLLLLSGAYGAVDQDFVAVSDGAGRIEAVGPEVTGWSVGDRVMVSYYDAWEDGPPRPGLGWGGGSPGRDGMLAEHVVVAADRLVALPDSVDLDVAATLPCAGLTAWSALNGDRPYTVRRVSSGDRVAVLGTGGVSLWALVLAQAVGAEVIATTGRDERRDALAQLGAVEIINYNDDDAWGQTIADHTGGGVDRVVNAVGSAVIDQALAAIAFGGEVALMGLFDFAAGPPDYVQLMTKGATIRGTAVGSRRALEDLVTVVAQHGLRVPISRTFAFADSPTAYRALEDGSGLGKVVIAVGAE